MSVGKSLGLLLRWVTASDASAAMRCGTALVSEGELMTHVLEKCGEPERRTAAGPAMRANGVPRRNAATISEFVYGPANGAYRYVHFVDEKLIRIELRRN